MFKRPHSTKTQTPIRSSDLRKLRDELVALFPHSLSKDDAKQLLPDGALTAKATSHLDEPLSLILAPSKGGAEPDARLFRVGKGNDGYLVPTVYALDLLPDLLPKLETAPMVVEPLVSGSALFLSGISTASLRSLPANAKEGDLVSIFIREDDEDGNEKDEELIVAIGWLAADRETLLKLQKEGGQTKGKGVTTLHARGDYLWQSGSQQASSPLASSAAPPSKRSPPPDESSSTADAAKDDSASSLASQLASLDVSEPVATSFTSTPPPPAAELTTAQVDTYLLNALLLSIRTLSSPSNSSLFPLSASALYSTYVLPSRPAFLPNGGAGVEIKKSRWKSLAKLIKEVSGKKWKDGPLLTAKEVRGEWVVTAVNGGHPDVDALRSYRTLAQAASSAAITSQPSDETTASAKNGASTVGASSSSTAAVSGVEVTEYFKPASDSIRELLSHVEHERPINDLYTFPLLLTLLRSYLTHFSLSHPRSPKLLLLHPSAHPTPSSLTLEQESAMELLAKVALGTKHEDVREVAKAHGREQGRAGCTTREEVGERIRQGCVQYWGLRSGREEEVIKKGSPPYIKVAIKNVGKRQVTLISGHEPWSLFTSEDLAEELKHKSASSTSIQPLAGSAKKGKVPMVEIMCQGTHDALVVKLLTQRFGVPKRYVEVDLSKSKK